MKNEIQKQDNQEKSVINFMACKFGMDKRAFEAVIKETVMPGNVTNEEFVAFLLVAKEYNLNPLTKEIYAFPKGGKVIPIVPIDGWVKIINERPELDGIQFKDTVENGQITSIECTIYRKDRKHPISATEYLAECKKNTEPWKQWPRRMLRHKALIQAARYAFGFSGIHDPDEGERMINVTPSKTANIPDNLVFEDDIKETTEESPVVDVTQKAPSKEELEKQNDLNNLQDTFFNLVKNNLEDKEINLKDKKNFWADKKIQIDKLPEDKQQELEKLFNKLFVSLYR